MSTHYKYTNHMFIPSDKLSEAATYVEQFDPGGDPEVEFGIFFSPNGHWPDTHRAGAGFRATEEQQTIINAMAAAIPGTVIFNADETTLSQAGATLGVFQITDE